MSLDEIRRQFTRTISKNIRSLDTLHNSFSDVQERWTLLLKKATESELSTVRILPSCLLKEIRSIGSQVRCIQQELVTYLGVQNTEDAQSLRGGLVSQCSSSLHRDCAQGYLHNVVEADARHFCAIVSASHQTEVSSSMNADNAEPFSRIMKARSLYFRVGVFAVWMSISLGDFDWLTSSFSAVEEYMMKDRGHSSGLNGQEPEGDVTRLFFGDGSSEVHSIAPALYDREIMMILLLLYYCFAREIRKATHIYFALKEGEGEMLSHDLRNVILYIARCIIQGEITELFSLMADKPIFFISEEENHNERNGCFHFPLSLFLRFMLEIFERPRLVNEGFDKVFRPVISLEVHPSQSVEKPPTLAETVSAGFAKRCTSGEKISFLLQVTFFHEKGGPWPIPQQLWRSMIS